MDGCCIEFQVPACGKHRSICDETIMYRSISCYIYKNILEIRGIYKNLPHDIRVLTVLTSITVGNQPVYCFLYIFSHITKLLFLYSTLYLQYAFFILFIMLHGTTKPKIKYVLLVSKTLGVWFLQFSNIILLCKMSRY